MENGISIRHYYKLWHVLLSVIYIIRLMVFHHFIQIKMSIVEVRHTNYWASNGILQDIHAKSSLSLKMVMKTLLSFLKNKINKNHFYKDYYYYILIMVFLYKQSFDFFADYILTYGEEIIFILWKNLLRFLIFN